MRELAPFFAHPWRLEAVPHGTTGDISRIVIQYQKHGDLFATDALDLHLFEGLIEAPYVFLPQHLHQKGLMIRALGRLTEACDADGILQERCGLEHCNTYRVQVALEVLGARVHRFGPAASRRLQRRLRLAMA